MCNCQFQLIMFAIFYLGRAALAAILSAFESQQYQGNLRGFISHIISHICSAVFFFEEKNDDFISFFASTYYGLENTAGTFSSC